MSDTTISRSDQDAQPLIWRRRAQARKVVEKHRGERLADGRQCRRCPRTGRRDCEAFQAAVELLADTPHDHETAVPTAGRSIDDTAIINLVPAYVVRESV